MSTNSEFTPDKTELNSVELVDNSKVDQNSGSLEEPSPKQLTPKLSNIEEDVRGETDADSTDNSSQPILDDQIEINLTPDGEEKMDDLGKDTDNELGFFDDEQGENNKTPPDSELSHLEHRKVSIIEKPTDIVDVRRRTSGVGCDHPRFRRISAEITGDFKSIKADTISISFSFSSVESGEDLNEQPDDSISDEIEIDEPKSRIDRPLYYEMHKTFDEKYKSAKIKNNYLQRKMCDYYAKRRMFYVMNEDSQSEKDLEKRYERELDALQNLYDLSENEQLKVSNEINEMIRKRNGKREEVANLFDKLQKSESEVGYNLNNNAFGKNMEKVVERFLRRQKSQHNHIIKMRLFHLKLQSKLAQKEEALAELDHLGPGFHIMDYQQLKIDNRNRRDRLEEKENELTKLRTRCQNAMQILAHYREKITDTNAIIETLNQRLDSTLFDFNYIREQLQYLREEKEKFRTDINKLKEESGLLAHPRFLRDMAETMDQLRVLSEELQFYKFEYKLKSEQVTAIRKNMEEYKAKSNAENDLLDGKENTASGRDISFYSKLRR